MELFNDFNQRQTIPDKKTLQSHRKKIQGETMTLPDPWITLAVIIFCIGCAIGGNHSGNSGKKQPTFNRYKKIHPGTPKTVHQEIDKDAVSCLIALGYQKKEAMERVMKVFSAGTPTQDIVKKAMQVSI